MLPGLDVIKKTFSAENTQALYNVAVEKFRLGDYQAAKCFMELIYFVNEDMTVHYFKTFGAILQALNEYEKAIASYKLALNIEYPAVKDCLFYIGVCFFKLNKYQEAQQQLQKFIKEDLSNKKLLPRAKLYLKLIEKQIE